MRRVLGIDQPPDISREQSKVATSTLFPMFCRWSGYLSFQSALRTRGPPRITAAPKVINYVFMGYRQSGTFAKYLLWGRSLTWTNQQLAFICTKLLEAPDLKTRALDDRLVYPASLFGLVLSTVSSTLGSCALSNRGAAGSSSPHSMFII